MKDLMVGAGTKYLAISLVVVTGAANFPSALRDGNLAADNPKQAKVAGVEYSRARVTGGGDVGDRGVEFASQIGRDRLAGEDPGAGRPFGNGHDDRYGRVMCRRSSLFTA